MKRLIVCLLFGLAAPSVVNAQDPTPPPDPDAGEDITSLTKQTFYSTGSPQTVSAVQIDVNCGGGALDTSGGIRITIPSTLNMTWDTGAPAPTTAMVGTGAGAVGAITFSNGNKTMDIAVTTNFASTQIVRITGARFVIAASAAAATDWLQLSHDGDLVVEAYDTNFIRIAGTPSGSCAGQTFNIGDPTTAITTITITDATHASLTDSRNLRIRIPSGLGMTWDSADSSATFGGSASAKAGAITYSGDAKTMFVDITTNFESGETLTIASLGFTAFGTVSTGNLEMSADNGATWVTISGLKEVGGTPTLTNATQVFAVADPSTSAGAITVQDAPGVAKITDTNNIRIRIPAGLNMEWDTTASVSFDESGLVGGNVQNAPGGLSYSADNKTMIINVTTSFDPGDTLVINGAAFRRFTAGSSATALELDVDNDGGTDATSATKSIGAPTISSAADQVFTTGTGSTPMSTITYTESAVGVMNSARGIRIRIPSGFDMRWNTGVTSATIGGPDAGLVTGAGPGSVTVTFADSNRTIVIPVSSVSNFPGGATITISALEFVGNPGPTFTVPELPDNLELKAHPSTVDLPPLTSFNGTDEDDKTVAVGGQPTIAATGNMSYAARDPASPLQADIVITDAAGVHTIDNSTDLRIRIAASFDMLWNDADTSIQITASATTAGKINGAVLVSGSTYDVPVTYENTGAGALQQDKVLVIGIQNDFSPDETFTILGASLSFVFPATGGGEAAQANVLELIVNGSPTSSPPADTDGANTIAIGAPTITFANQIFGTGDPGTANNTITIAEDGATPTIRITNGIRVRIPAAAALTWDTTDLVATFGGSAAGKVLGISYPDSKTLLISLTPVTGDFAATDTLTIDNLTFLPGLAESGPHQLDLIVSGAALTVTDTSNPGTGDLIISNRPTITSVLTLDTSANGVLDQIIVTFSEDINGATASVATGAGFTFGTYTIVAGTETAAGVVTYLLVESGTPDTGATPALAYNPATGSLTDVFGLEMNAVAAFPSTDGAPPRIMGLAVSDANGDGTLDRLTFTFSEPIAAGLDVGDWQIVGADGANLLPGATLTVVGSTLVFDVVVPISAAALPRYRYDPTLNANGVQLADASGNAVVAQSNNTAPVSNAGPDQSLPPTRVTLDGTASVDPDGQSLTYAWAQTGGPAGVTLSSATSPTPTFLATVDGAYTFTLTVSDGLVTTPDSVTIAIINVAPNADAGFDQTVDAGTAVTLDASDTVDVNGDVVTFAWAQVSGPAAAPLSGSGATRTFTTTGLNGVWVFEVTASDGLASGTDRVTVRVNAAGNAVPTANAGPDLVATVGATVTFNGALSWDPEGAALSYAWTSPFALTGATTAAPTFTPTFTGLFTFTLVVTASGVDSAPDTVNVLVIAPSNLPPTAAAARIAPAGDPIVGDTVTLDASGSADPEGAALIYSWLQVAGPSALLVGPSSLQPSFVPVAAGTYVFRLVAGDGVQNSPPVDIAVPVLPAAGTVPTAVASIAAADDPDGDGRVLSSAPLPVDLTGAASTPGGLSFFWVQTDGPAVPLAGAATSAPSFFPSLPGVYRFTLTVIDAAGVRDDASLTVVVDAANEAPTADAGPDRSGAAGQAIGLDGSASFDPVDADAVTGFSNGLTAFWTQVAGPAAALSDPYAASPSFVPSAAGTYVFALVVSDGVAQSAPDTVAVTVSGSPGGDGGGGGGGGGCGLTGLEPLLFLAVLRRRRIALTPGRRAA